MLYRRFTSGEVSLGPLCYPNSRTNMFLIDWRRVLNPEGELKLLSLFADDPEAPFSIHRFVEYGASACGKHPGEWFGPSATARCIE
jgi:hypothetical protein